MIDADADADPDPERNEAGKSPTIRLWPLSSCFRQDLATNSGLFTKFVRRTP
jgi:hypothetical protein